MDLPTYTNIWRIEKRLYKLYDLRLPMPLPIVWIGVFVGVLVPWWVLLALVGLPFDAPWHVIYLVPPGVLTWLSTRPVIENKRLTELLQSQLRYLVEPRTWCRMAPLGEPDEITFTARVWRATPRNTSTVAPRSASTAVSTSTSRVTSAAVPIETEASRRLRRLTARSDSGLNAGPVPASQPSALRPSASRPETFVSQPSGSQNAQPAMPEPAPPQVVISELVTPELVRPEATPERVAPVGSTGAPGMSIRAVGSAAGGVGGPASPAVPPIRPSDEHAPKRPPQLRRVEAVVGRDPAGGWRRLAQVVVGGGHRDATEIDLARVRAELTTSRRIMVLGCTGGAGQTVTALMLGHTLARYRMDRVLALDANTGADTLTTRIAADSPETLSSLLAGSESVTGYLGMRAYTTRCESGLEVVGADADDATAQRLADHALLAGWRRTLAALDRHYQLTVIDPAAALTARLLPYTDQLVLVAPASEDAPNAIAMTYEWLDGHGCADLRRRAVMVINGVSRRSMPDVEQAEAVASGRCRAIVRVPWEDELAPGRPGPVDVEHLRAGGRRAYLALAGVIVNSLVALQAKQEVASR